MITVAALRPAPRAPRDLTQKLKTTLRRSKIRKVDAHIGIDDSHEGHVREIEPLGDHLRAEQHVHIAPAHAIENLGVRPLAACRVDIHAGQARRRKPLAEELAPPAECRDPFDAA